MSKLICRLLVVLAFGWAGSANAGYIRYSYQGNNLDTVESYSSISDFPSVTSVSVWFDVALPLLPNWSGFADVVSYHFTDGVSEISSAANPPNNSQFVVRTDYLGNIVNWDIFADNFPQGYPVPLLLGDVYSIGTQVSGPDMIDYAMYCMTENVYGECQTTEWIFKRTDPGTWSISEVPTPATLPLLGIGLAALGYRCRKRKQHI